MGFGEFMAKVLRRKEGGEGGVGGQADDVEEKKAALEEMNKALPKAVSGREAVLKKREQLRQIDKILEER